MKFKNLDTILPILIWMNQIIWLFKMNMILETKNNRLSKKLRTKVMLKLIHSYTKLFTQRKMTRMRMNNLMHVFLFIRIKAPTLMYQ